LSEKITNLELQIKKFPFFRQKRRNLSPQQSNKLKISFLDGYFQKELEEKIIGPLSEKITNLDLQIKKLLKEYENFKTFTVTSYFDDIQILKKDLEILKGDLPDIIDCYYHH